MIINILIKRDGMSKEDASALVEETKQMIIADPWNAEDIMLEMLGLEMDYILELF